VPSRSDHQDDSDSLKRLRHSGNGKLSEPRTSELTEFQKPLDAFRSTTRRSKIHPLEVAALWVVCAHLVFLPWALGGMRVWAQVPSFALGAVSLLLALLPRNYTDEHTGANSFRLIMWPKLVKFPIFWTGIALLGYIILQALNPAWMYETGAKGWWMRKIEAKSWLPTGVVAPFEKWNQWRMFIIYASSWMTVCTIWIAFTRRRTVQLFLVTLAVNGLLVAMLGVAQRITKAGKIYWFFESPNPAFFSSFIYKNHGAAYLDIILAITCGLASWFYVRGLRRLEKSNPSGVLAFFATCIGVAVLISYARGATLVMLGFLLACIGAFVVHQFMVPKVSRRPVAAIMLVFVFGSFLKTGLEALRSGEAWDRLKQGISRNDTSLAARERVTAAALEMLREQGNKGIGAGSFRFLFPIYQHRHPMLVADADGPWFWEHAHNDIVQFPIELGALGCGMLVFGAGYWVVALARAYFWENPLSATLVFGASLLVVYAWWDFPFQCPAILITWSALWPAATMWARFEEAGAKS
jgi:hypothetical protein